MDRQGVLVILLVGSLAAAAWGRPVSVERGRFPLRLHLPKTAKSLQSPLPMRQRPRRIRPFRSHRFFRRPIPPAASSYVPYYDRRFFFRPFRFHYFFYPYFYYSPWFFFRFSPYPFFYGYPFFWPFYLYPWYGWWYDAYPWWDGGRRIAWGEIWFDVRPDDALIWVDGRLWGRASRLNGWWRSQRLRVGRHTVRIEHEDFPPCEVTVYVRPGETVSVQLDLRENPEACRSLRL